MKHIGIILLLAVISLNCQKEFSIDNGPTSLLPTITTTAITSITNTTALSGGNITADGGAAITARGVCWSTAINPVVTGSHTTDGTGTGIFASTITGLTPNTTYHVRAYATNTNGTAYGSDSVFITTASTIALPAVTTSSLNAITATTAAGGGNVTADGGAAVTARGVCWSITVNPVATGNHTTDGTGTGIFTSAITGLTAGTLYHVRAYATNSMGTAYGGDSVFTTAHDIYVGGYQHIGSGSVEVATIWKNGIATTLTSGVYDAYVTSVFVLGQEVYAVGTETQIGPAGLVPYAMLWKNGVPTRLSDKSSNATCVYVSGSDVYIGGSEDFYPATWKNGVVTVLSGGANYGLISGIFVYGTDVYLAGSVLYAAKVWKNGAATTLAGSIAGNSARANGIFVNNSDVYVSGSIVQVPSQEVAAVWKNGVSTSLTNGAYYSYAQAVCVVNNDVYVTGSESDGSGLNTIRGKVWKNGVATLLSGSNTGGNAIRLLDSDVYVAGTENLTSGTTANIWKNGVPTVLSPVGIIADAYCIFIK